MNEVDFARTVIMKLAKILQQMHSNGVTHRSLSPDCIVMDQGKREFKVSFIRDFDTAIFLQKGKMVKQCFDVEGLMVAPELSSGDAQDSRVDVWSLGQILY